MAQSQIFYLSAMEPVLAAIAEFPFGQNETGLIQDTAEKLQQTGQKPARSDDRRVGRRGGKRLCGIDDPAFTGPDLCGLPPRGNRAADCRRRITIHPPRWTRYGRGFDLRLAMLESLLGSAVPDDETAPVAPAAPVQAPPQAAAPAQPAPPPRSRQVRRPPPARWDFFAHKTGRRCPPHPPPPAAPGHSGGLPASSAPVEQPTMARWDFSNPGLKKADETGGAQ
jgi:hypothetical protein